MADLRKTVILSTHALEAVMRLGAQRVFRREDTGPI
jgi:ABC-type multidrug transport system ATPase subunit